VEDEKVLKKKSLKEAKVAQIVFCPLLAHYLYLAFAVFKPRPISAHSWLWPIVGPYYLTCGIVSTHVHFSP